MLPAGDIVAIGFAGLLSVPFLTLAVETLAALLPVKGRAATNARPRVAVLVPAHDEEAGIAATIAHLRPQLRDGDRLVVIADNCSDSTANVARTAGATVLERHDADRRGKGFALDFGLRHLADDPPQVVIVIDADCETLPGAIDGLAVAGVLRPAQAVNVLDAPAGSGPGARIGSFAFYFKNVIRPRGMTRLGLPCLLYGTGMALPWAALKTVDLAHGDITEDIRLGAELAAAGFAPQFCPEATVRGELPSAARVARTQRRRWEHGHLRTLIREVPKLLWRGLTRGRPRLIGLALHLGVPPLAFLFLIGGLSVAALAGFGQWNAVAIVVSATTASVVGILSTWAYFGRDRLPGRDLVLLPFYVVGKVPLYLGFVFRPERRWIRTERTSPPTGGDPDG